MLNILLLGAGGFIGRNLAAFFTASGHRVVLQTRSGAIPAGFESVQCGIDDLQRLRSAIVEYEIDVIMHLASGLIPSSGRAAFDVELKALVNPTFHLIDLAAELGKTFVFFSSGGAIYSVPDDAPLREDGVLAPLSYYGYSKIMIEQYIQMLALTKGLRYLILRPSNPYGRHQRGDGKQGLIAAVLSKVLRGESVEVWGDGSIVRDYILVDDLSAMVEQVLRKDVSNLVVNIGCGRGYSINEVIHLIEKISGHRIEVQYRQGRSVDRPRIVLDVRRARSLGVAQPLDLESGLGLVWRELATGSV